MQQAKIFGMYKTDLFWETFPISSAEKRRWGTLPSVKKSLGSEKSR